MGFSLIFEAVGSFREDEAARVFRCYRTPYPSITWRLHHSSEAAFSRSERILHCLPVDYRTLPSKIMGRFHHEASRLSEQRPRYRVSRS
jgi:hypothetical protein